MNTATPEEVHAARRQAVQETLVFADATEAGLRLRRFLETTSGGAGEFDQRFLDFLKRHQNERLLAASAGDGFEVVFSPRDAFGYWLFASNEGASGKGFLGPHDTARVLEIARLKGLLATNAC